MFLVVTARLLLFPLFLKHVHFQRNMQSMQPVLDELRATYGNDQAELNRQIVRLQREKGVNPLTGCLPILLQIPVFLGLYHVLRHLSNAAALCTAGGRVPSPLLRLYTFTPSQTCSAAQAKLFGAPLAASFRHAADQVRVLGGDLTTTQLVILSLLIISAAVTLGTQLLVRANAVVASAGTAALVQRATLYLFPLGLLAAGVVFPLPLGILLYWFTSNLWTLMQQAYVNRLHPRPDGAPEPASSRQHVRQVGRGPVTPNRSRRRKRRIPNRR